MLHRRDAMLRLGQVGLGALTLPQLLQSEKAFAAGRKLPHLVPTGGKAKSCILIYLWGGPPQMDMWDPNPEAADSIRSHFAPINTVVPGIDISEEMPLFAKQTDKTAIIRSLSHDSNNHEPSVYRSLTGHINRKLRVPLNDRKRTDEPNLGSILSCFSPMGSMPTTVTIPRPIGHDGSTYAGTYAGWLGARHDPMEVAAAEETGEKPTHSMALPADLSSARLLARRGLLNVIEEQDRRFQDDPFARGMDEFREQAFSMLSSSKAKDAFSIDKEDPKTRDRYGRNEWGESILLARRLVEAGVRLVTISWMYIQKSGNVANVWDNHGPFEGKTGYEMLKAEYCLPSLDRGFHALMDDLSESGMLDETMIAMFGEFGRTPKINKNKGRDHWGAVQSGVLAGGGIQGGQVYGTSDRDSAYPTSKPVSPEDMLATIYHGMGMSPESVIYDQLNRPHRIVSGTPLTSLFG
ncbi:MAG: DUF1501 domain-containing protein [Planctomycetaceae bacterium]|jgi:hypothetical protein|nr:DUF1501 domain-containing protein [Planctomycetaceae bacterium]MBT6487278.1 DUF1501 domain-containing protein [Planctomycetaceae bacterium]